jgi:hypothetical protein
MAATRRRIARRGPRDGPAAWMLQEIGLSGLLLYFDNRTIKPTAGLILKPMLKICNVDEC